MTILDRPREVEEAADLLVHYFKRALPDVEWCSDYDTEIRAIAYNIYDAVRDAKS